MMLAFLHDEVSMSGFKAFILTLLLLTVTIIFLSAQDTLERVEINIDADPSSLTMRIKTRLILDSEGAEKGTISRIYLQFLEPAEMISFVVEETGENVETRYLMDKLTAKRAGYNIIEVKYKRGSGITILSEEYMYDLKSFSGSVFSPSGLGNLLYGQLNKKNIFSTHLFYYPVSYPSTRNEPRTAEIRINVPRGWTGITSGELVEKNDTVTGVSYIYSISFPSFFVPYPLAIYPYESISEVYDRRFPVSIYFDPSHKYLAAEKLSLIIDKILPFLENLMGVYPYSSLTIAEVFPWEGEAGAALKSFILLSDNVYFASPIDGDYLSMPATVLVDEIAHQWNFHKVSYPGYLSEGISTYTDSLFHEHIYGKSRLDKDMERFAESYKGLVAFIADIKDLKDRGFSIEECAEKLGKTVHDLQPYWSYADKDELPISNQEVLHTLYFYKGAIAIDALRDKLGDKLFFKGFKDLFSGQSGRVATIDDYKETFERAGGIDLGNFIRLWYYGTGLPE